MLVSEVINKARNQLGEPNPSQRWPDSVLIDFCDTAQKVLMRDIRWPESRFVLNAISGVQEYTFQEVLKILRVYLNGQPLVRTDINTLEGIQTQFYDQTGTSGGPGGLIASGLSSPLITGNYTPQWTGAPAVTYPVGSSLSAPAPDAQPYYPGQRPRYYLRGGNLGIVPPPSGTPTFVVDCIRQPPTILSAGSTMVLPSIFEDALVWKICELCYFSDVVNPAREQLTAQSEKKYGAALGDIRFWKRDYSGQGPRGPKPLTQRSFGIKGRNRYYCGGNWNN